MFESKIFPAVSPLAIPALEHALLIENVRCENETYAQLCGDIRSDIVAQLAAAHNGDITWVNSKGVVYGSGGIVVGGIMPTPGSNSFCDPLGY